MLGVADDENSQSSHQLLVAQRENEVFERFPAALYAIDCPLIKKTRENLSRSGYDSHVELILQTSIWRVLDRIYEVRDGDSYKGKHRCDAKSD